MKNIIIGLTNILLSSTGIEQIDTGLNVIKTLGIGVCAAIGVPALVKGGIDFASGISQRDQSGIVTGGLEIAGGLIMTAISVFIGLAVGS